MSVKQKIVFLSVLFSFSFVSFILGWFFAGSFYPRQGNELKSFLPGANDVTTLSPSQSSSLDNSPSQDSSPSKSSSVTEPPISNSSSENSSSPKKNPTSDLSSLKASPSNLLSEKNNSDKALKVTPNSSDKNPLTKNSSDQNPSNSSPFDRSSKSSKPLLDAKESFINSPLYKEMRDNMLVLFDPYAMDQLHRKDTVLNQKNSYIHKDKKTIQLKKSLQKSTTEADNKKTSLLVNSPLLKRKGLQDSSSKQNSSDLLLKKEKTSLMKKFEDIHLDPFLQKLQKSYNEKNREQLLSIEKQQKFFKSSGKFSFLVNVFSEEEKAFEYIEKIKKEYPFWSLLLKAHGDHIRIYLGPFVSKESAMEFKKELPLPYPFSSLDYLEKVGLEP